MVACYLRVRLLRGGVIRGLAVARDSGDAANLNPIGWVAAALCSPKLAAGRFVS